MALIAFSGYISSVNFGRILLTLIIIFVLIVFFQDSLQLPFHNVVPEKSRDLFYLISILFSIYLLGNFFGKILATNLKHLYLSRKELEKKAVEKEVLLKEVHHRVKNNLQTISSLLNMQARNTENAETKRILTNSHNRILSMAIVHEMLYERDDLYKISYKEYVKELGKYLIKSLNKEEKDIQLDLKICNIKFNIETAIPLGLLISEFMTNSIKHAFVNQKGGVIFIHIEQPSPDYFHLTMGDDGVGFKDLIYEAPKKSLGLKLVNNLVRQLKGLITKNKVEKGTSFTVKFQEI
ncbi:sensor histidine kinase [Galbibacter sp. EGI 63066]|uniref:sensor histidine kinase n=1 Tax=Galbibacter sp. EGI 63066 TaxID=2993559 RepID=UPI002248C74D|nr:sensor histidine kinase [Galbibacter sp. EGI 63066]MCX2680214.1 sensor histidine kinase [Galbibacter sp. EGI 63066]